MKKEIIKSKLTVQNNSVTLTLPKSLLASIGALENSEVYAIMVDNVIQITNTSAEPFAAIPVLSLHKDKFMSLA